MGRLAWIETPDGWSSGAYRIELAVPGLWVLSRGDGPRATILETSGSLSGLKNLVDSLEARTNRRSRLTRHGLGVVFAVVLAVLSPNVSVALVVPAVILVFVVSLRMLLAWVDTVTERSWDRLSDLYQ
jgi:hypothetical protein